MRNGDLGFNEFNVNEILARNLLQFRYQYFQYKIDISTTNQFHCNIS